MSQRKKFNSDVKCDFKIGVNPCPLTLLPTCDVHMFEIKGYKAIGKEIGDVGTKLHYVAYVLIRKG